MEQFRNLDEVLNAIARFMDKPRNPARAMMDLCEKLTDHWPNAGHDYDEITDIVNHAEELERENEELRRRLRAAGLNDKIEEKESVAA